MYNPKIALDLDGVVANFHAKLIETFNTKFGEQYRAKFGRDLTIHDIDCELEKLPPEVYKQAITIFNEPGWFINLEPLPDAIQLVSRFIDLEYETTICTAPARTLQGTINGRSADEKFQWLQKQLPFWANNAIITKHKELVGTDLLIDDTGHNIINWCNRHSQGIGYLVDQPWNQKFRELPVNSVRGSLRDVPELIKEFWCHERGQFIFRYEELKNWKPKL